MRTINKFNAVMLILFGLLMGGAHAESPQQKWVGDVPIMPSLTIEKGLGFAFDNADGRIVTIYLSGTAKAEKVAAYYQQALEPLGWQKDSQRRWKREGEVLEINTTTAAGVPLWKITLRPQ